MVTRTTNDNERMDNSRAGLSQKNKVCIDIRDLHKLLKRHDSFLTDIRGMVLHDESKFLSCEEDTKEEVAMVMDVLLRHEKKI